MSKDEFLRGLEEALAGRVQALVIRENVAYYSGYISQELAKGRTMEDIVDEIGDPRIVARTIIDSSEAAGETIGEGGFAEEPYDSGYSRREERSAGEQWSQGPKIHYFDLNKWYWKLLLAVILLLVVMTVFSILGGIFSLLIRFSGLILMILLLYWFIRGMRR